MLGAVSLTFFIWLIIFSVQVLYAVAGGEHCGDKKQIGHLAGVEGSGEKRVVRGRLRKGSFLIENSTEQKQGDVAGTKAMKNPREGISGRYWIEISLRYLVKAAWE